MLKCLSNTDTASLRVLALQPGRRLWYQPKLQSCDHCRAPHYWHVAVRCCENAVITLAGRQSSEIPLPSSKRLHLFSLPVPDACECVTRAVRGAGGEYTRCPAAVGSPVYLL